MILFVYSHSASHDGCHLLSAGNPATGFAGHQHLGKISIDWHQHLAAALVAAFDSIRLFDLKLYHFRRLLLYDPCSPVSQ